ncbi:MAG: aminotransferase class V-fold PLP-dependent enzyme [Burkholderiales bacterium]|nr:MAG: aminotransferase class V-fold PLP-dependent enzyme [Burkholderiales bacterium]
MQKPLVCQRHDFNIDPNTEGHIWLNSAYMGPLPLRTQRAGEAALKARAFPVSITPRDFFEPAERVREMLATLVNSNQERIAFVPNVAHGMAIVAKNFTPKRGQNIVLLGEQFPSNVYPWRDWRDIGVELRTVVAPDAPWSTSISGRQSRASLWNEAILNAIDPSTAMVSIEQAHWTDGTLFDLASVGRRCREVGALFVIDATQTVGAMPFDCEAIQPDALIVHSYKSMLSNYGLGFAVFSEKFTNAKPLEESWLMRAGSDNFARLVDYQDEYDRGMRRFDTSLRANPLLIGMLGASVQCLVEWQPVRIREYLLDIEREFVERVRAMGFEVTDEPERAANIFGLKLPQGANTEACRAALAERKIHVSVRGSSIRVSPHVYNDANDLLVLSDALSECL